MMASQLVSNVTHARKDVASPATSPLLSFLLHFAKEERNYVDVIKDTKGEVLWELGRKALIPACTPSPDDSSDVVDESEQDKEKFLDIINGPGLKAVPPGTTVG